jgi:hypothetical protein
LIAFASGVFGAEKPRTRFCASKPFMGISAKHNAKPANGLAGAGGKKTPLDDDEVVNDSLGTIVPADSTGVDEEKETGDAKDKNFNTKED